MAGHLQRTQILLEPEQHQALAEMAAREGRSISDVVREMIRQSLEHQRVTEMKRDQERTALAQIREHREEILKRRRGQPIDLDVVDLIHQMWDEQDERNLSGFANAGD